MSITKKTVSHRLPECKVAYIKSIAERTGKKNSHVLEALLDTLELYFTDEQIDMEVLAHEHTDYRKKKE